MAKIGSIEFSHSAVYSEIMDEFMAKRSWQKHKCDSCGRTFFAKKLIKEGVVTCGWNKCDEKQYLFRNLSKRKQLLTPLQINSKISEYFQSIGFNLTVPKNIINNDSKTDLIVAGVQVFDNVIHHSQKPNQTKVFIAQPCIRTQFQPFVESQDGVSTAFVNICTEQINVSFGEYLQSVDYWLTILSKLGLHMDNFKIIMRSKFNDWGTGEFLAFELFFSYEGLELGDASYMSIPNSDQEQVIISDIGFGLERINWAVNKTESYYDMLTPVILGEPKEMYDLCRSLVLLGLCGTHASNKGAGLQFRRFAKLVSDKYYGKDINFALSYYYDYWSQFIEPVVSKVDTIQAIQLEVERYINLKVCEMLKLPSPHLETTEAYFERLVYTRNINIYDLREALKICKP